MRSLLRGVEKHLHSPIESVRTLGMVVAEFLMNDLHSQEIEKLKFQVSKSTIILKLSTFELKISFLKKVHNNRWNQKSTVLGQQIKTDRVVSVSQIRFKQQQIRECCVRFWINRAQ